MNKYTAYGYRQKLANDSEISYNGDYEIDGLFLMGNGYRLYSPSIRRFYSPDSMSPGRAGVNPYTYNLGDPINRSDPSGHLSIGQWISIGLGIAGILVSVLSLGLGAAAGAGMITLASGSFLASMAATSVTSVVVESIGLVAGAVALASEFSDNKQLKKAGEILGYVSFGLAIGPSIAKGVSKGITKAVNKALKPTIAKNGVQLPMSGRGAGAAARAMIGERSIGTLEDIINSSKQIGAGAVGTAYLQKYSQRVFKVHHSEVDKNTSIIYSTSNNPERSARLWNEFYSTAHNGELSHLATAEVLRTSDGYDLLSTPFVKFKNFGKNQSREAFVNDIVKKHNRYLADSLKHGNVGKYYYKGKKYGVIIDFDFYINVRRPSFPDHEYTVKSFLQQSYNKETT